MSCLSHRILIGPRNIRSVSIEVELPKQLLCVAKVVLNKSQTISVTRIF